MIRTFENEALVELDDDRGYGCGCKSRARGGIGFANSKLVSSLLAPELRGSWRT